MTKFPSNTGSLKKQSADCGRRDPERSPGSPQQTLWIMADFSMLLPALEFS
jgi:hypothetical protein